MELFYKSDCLGLEGRPIQILKIRTMRKDVNGFNPVSLEASEFDVLGKPKEDPRPTFLGRMLRRYWIDELPQIRNLLNGEMKLVGIRPCNQEGWTRYPISIKERALKYRPGLLGVHYAHEQIGGFERHLEILEEYLDLYEKDPSTTDRLYFNKIMRNIILNGIRSH